MKISTVIGLKLANFLCFLLLICIGWSWALRTFLSPSLPPPQHQKAQSSSN